MIKPFHSTNQQQDIVRVACIGDSITYGGGVQNRELDSYPKVLGRLLGARYFTRNFGVSGATVLKKCEMEGDVSYWVTPEFRAVTDFQPHLLIMKFGTNDSKPPTWKHKAEFEGDLNAMWDHFETLPSQPKIWICIPVPAFKAIGGINEQVLQGEIAPTIRRVAQKRNVSVVDLHSVLQDRPDCFPDGVHPNEAGAKVMAETVWNAVKSS